MKKISLVIAGLLLLTTYAFAAPIDGRWTGSFEAEGFGELPLGYDLKADGNKLTGTADGPSGPIDIKNGKIDGNKISFEYSFDYQGSEIALSFTGVLSGKSLKLSWTSGMGGPATEATVTKE